MTALDEFFKLLDDYKKTLAWALGSSAILPMVASFAGLAPIWPPASPLLTSLFTLIAIVFSFQFLRRAAKRRVNAAMIRALVGLVVFLIVYLILFDMFTYTLPTTGEIVHVGCGWSEMSQEVTDIYGIDRNGGCPGNYERIFASSSYNNTLVWNRAGLTGVKMGLALTWFGFFVSVSILLGAFLVFQSGRQSVQPK